MNDKTDENAAHCKRTELESALFSAEGSFTSRFREAFREKRLSLGMTFEAVGELFQQNWSTVRKWENGITSHVAPYIRKKLIDFIDGTLDVEAQEVARRAWRRNSGGGLAGEFEACLKRASSALKMCEEYPQLCQEMMNVMDQAAQYTLEKMVFEKSERSNDDQRKQNNS